MPYGTIKVDTITFTDAGVDKSVAISGLVQNPTFTGNVTATGTISGLIVQAPTVTGTTANFASGVYTTQISGALVKVPAGSAGAPSIQVGVGTSVAPGLYGAGTDILGISTGGAGRIFIDSTGRLGVGTNSLTTQGAQKLTVFDGSISTTNNTSSAANGELRFIGRPDGVSYNWAGIRAISDVNVNQGVLAFFTSGSNTSGESSTERLRINDSGRVGIGTSSPSDRLHVANGYFRVTGPAGDGSNIYLYANNATTNPVRIGQGYNNATDNIGFIVNTAAAGLILGTNNAERLSITSAGNVGIGASSPTYKLVVDGGSGANVGIRGGSYGLRIDNNVTFGLTGTVIHGVDSTFAASYQPLVLNGSQLGFATGGTERLRIDSSGRLLMGATSTNEGSTAIFQGYDGLSTNPGVVRICKGVATPSSSEVLGYLAFGDSSHATAAYMSAVRDGGTWTSGSSLPTALTFATVANGTILPTERMRIDSSGRLLVGTSTARSSFFNAANTAGLQVEGLNSNTAAISIVSNNNTAGNAPCLVLGRTRGTAVNGNNPVLLNDVIGSVSFQGADGADLVEAARIEVQVDAASGGNDMPGRVVFSTTADGQSAPSEIFRITSNRYLRLASTANGIQFNGDTAGVNALDDYEEGTWTPTLLGSSNNPTVTYNTQNGTYTKIGRLVTCRFFIQLSSFTGGSGQVLIGGLPFASNNNVDTFSDFNLPLATNLIYPAGCSTIILGLSPNSTSMEVAGIGSNSTGGSITYGTNLISVAGTQFLAVVTYNT